jgi:hypothetical protein
LLDRGETTYFPEEAERSYNIRELIEGIEDRRSRSKEDFREREPYSDRPSQPIVNVNIHNINQQQTTAMTQEPDPNPKPAIVTKPSLWSTGGFFLLAIVVITAMAAIISAYVPWYIIPIVFIFGILGVGVIGAFILRYNGELSEPNFLKLMIETYKRIPLLIQGKSPKK